MGSWWATCGLTNNHIMPGEDARIILITQSLTPDAGGLGHCYPVGLWTPRTYAFKATYEDYGSFVPKEEDSWHVDFIVSKFKQDLHEYEQGENKYHDIPVKKDQLSWEFMLKAMHANRLHVNCMNVFGEGIDAWARSKAAIGLFPVAEWAWKAIMDTKFEGWRGELTVQSSYTKTRNTLQRALVKVREDIGRDPELGGRFGVGSMLLREVFRDSGESAGYTGGTSRSDYKDLLIDNMDDPMWVHRIIHLMAEAEVFDYVMSATRKSYMPQAGLGSQACDPHPYEVLCNAQLKHLADERAELGEEYDD